jgi:hypothetical protein
MDNIVLYCKSYRGDLGRVKVQSESIKKYNVDNIPYYISVPPSDIDIFKAEIPFANIINDDDIMKCNLPPWQSQQIVKSSFWKLGLCKNYLCLDSDQYFIRPFNESDFIVSGTDICYTVMHEEKDLFNWTINKTKILGFDPIQSFESDRRKIMEIFSRTGKMYDFGPSPILWNCHVWSELERTWLIPNKLTFEDAIKHVPSEFSWYGEFLLASKCIPIMPIEPLFKVFHYKQQYIEAKQQGYTEEDYAKIYIGTCLQSNWGAPMRY